MKNLKNTLLLTLIVFSSVIIKKTSTAQPPPNLSLSEQMDYLMAPLDFTEVSSGLLLDKGFPMMEIATFDGSANADTLKEYGDWFRQFGTMVTSKTSTTSPIGITADYKIEADSLLANGIIPLMVLHAEYHKFISDSTTLSTLITFQNNQLNDVPGRTSSPYALHEIVSFSPKKNTFYDNLSHDFRLNTDFIRTNVAKTIATIQIDFDNGSGYQTIALGVNTRITWSNFGKKILKLKITYTDSSVYHAKSQIHLANRSGGQPKFNAQYDDSVYIPHPTIPNHGVGLVMSYGCGNSELRKPFIYVEGFNPEFFNNQYYEEDFFQDFVNYEFKWDEGFPLLSELDENGYDVVYVDFERGDGSLIENAKALQAAINWINDQKAANNSTSDNILVGSSMGGVVARLALTYMEDDNEDHEVSYYVSLDAPHRGANVPRGITAALIDIRNYEFAGFSISEDVPKVEQAYQVLFSPAARQMLIYSGEGSNSLVTGHGSTYTSFQHHLHVEQGMPTETLQNIAIAKGGGTGVGQFGSATDIFNIDANTFNILGCITDVPDVVGWFAGAFAFINLGLYVKLKMDINAMPSYVNYDLQIYERKIRLFKTLPIIPIPYFYWDSHKTYAKTVNSYDGVQGGTMDVSAFNSSGSNVEDFIQDVIDGEFEPCIKLKEQTITFVPTVSALDMGDFMGAPNSGSPNVQIDPITIVSNSQTSFEKAFILDPTKYPSGYVAPSNESHPSLTPSNVFPFSKVISPDFNAVNENPTVHGYTFNFGYAKIGNVITETTDRITHPITVSGLSSANGALWLNRNGRLENINDQNNPHSTSNHFTVELSRSCDYTYGRVTVEEYGSIIIGESSNKTADFVVRQNSWIKMNDGFIEVRKGSKLIIENGGTLRLNGGLLRVQDGGEVIIKAGGKLIYEKDAQIELNGNDAVLSLGGLTHIGNDATFTFTYQGSESGYIRMLKEGHWGQRFSAGTNADVILQGENKDDLILYLEEDVDFWEFDPLTNIPGETYISQMFEKATFKNGKIIMEDNARIVLLGESRFQRTTVEALNPGHQPRGITPLTFCYISSSTFNDMYINALLHYWESGALHIETSAFNNSVVATRGYGYTIRSSVFNFSLVHSEYSTIVNSISHSEFNHSSQAVTDWSPTELFVYKTKFTENRFGIWKTEGRVTAKCSEFIQNETAIMGDKGSVVNLSTLFNGGYNHFAQNDYNIQLFQGFGLQLEDGYNEFYEGNIMNIEGTLDISSNPCPPPIIAYNNIWTPTSYGGPMEDPNHPDGGQFNVSIIENIGMPWANLICQIQFRFGPVAAITSCGKYDDPRVPTDPIQGPDPKGPRGAGGTEIALNDFPLINSPTYFTDTPFNIAMKMAALNTTVADTLNGNDLIAADMYYELLYSAQLDSTITDSMAVIIEKMRWGSLNNYKATIERLFADSVLFRTNNQVSFEPTIGNYVDVLMHFTDSIKTDKNYKQQFQLEIWKSSLLSTIGKKQQALHILSNINNCDHDSIQKIILLEQIQSLEFDLIRSQLNINTFLTDSVTFVVDSTIYDIPLESYISTTGFGSYIMSPNSILFSACNTPIAKPSKSGFSNGDIEVVLYPNPAQNYLNISFLKGNLSSESILTLRIFELTGKEIFNTNLLPQNVRIYLPELANALYIYRLEMSDKTITQGKISIME